MKKQVKWLLIAVVLICLFCATALASDPNDFVGSVVDGHTVVADSNTVVADSNTVVVDPNVGSMLQLGPSLKLVPWFRVSVSVDGVLEVKYGNGLTLSQVARIFFYEQVRPLADQYIQRRRQEIVTEFSTRWNRFCAPINPVPDSNNLPVSR